MLDDKTGKDICIERRYWRIKQNDLILNPGHIRRYLGLANDPRRKTGFLAIGLKDGYARKYDCVDVIKYLYKQSGE